MVYRTQPLLFLLVCSSTLFGQVDVLTANYDNNRTNANLSEFLLNTSNVNPTQFGKLYAFPVDGQVYAQPLYVHGLKIPGKGTVNVLFVATMHNTVYAFDADAKSGTVPLWTKNFGPSVNPHDFDLPPNPKTLPQGAAYDDILNEIGILATPVSDPSTNTLYVVHYTFTTSGTTKTYAYYLHALDLVSGEEKFSGPVPIQATVPGTGWVGSDTTPGNQLTFNAGMHLQRPGLLLVNGVVYVAFGSHGDFVPWHGWLFGYGAENLQQMTVFNTTANAAAAAIWQGGRGLAADSAGDIYLSTGNGSWDGTQAWGQSVLRLAVDGGVRVADYFTPAQWDPLNANDTDVGSSGPVLIPGTNLLYSIGKDGDLYLLDRAHLGQQSPMNQQTVQTFEAAVPGISETLEENGSFIFNTALWNKDDGPLLYLWPPASPPQPVPQTLRSYRMATGIFETTPSSTNPTEQSQNPRAGMAVSANGSFTGTGILWATSATARHLPAAGTLRAFDALDLTQELWNSDMQSERDALGGFSKFANPTVANGKVFAPTASGEVVVYGLLPGVPGIASVVNSASYVGGAVAPGELITIFGDQIGPASASQAALNPLTGQLPFTLGGVQITFDDLPAPLLYGSTGQINAVVPFSVAGQSTVKMRVTGLAGGPFTMTLPVAAAAPAIFTKNSSGSGQGAILNNADYSKNSSSNPVARGSVIAIYATGMGATNPPSTDGLVAPVKSPPLVALPVSVTIGGQPAQVLYQGAAPGLVAGVAQIDALVPTSIEAGSAVPVVVTVGNTAAQNTVTVAVK